MERGYTMALLLMLFVGRADASSDAKAASLDEPLLINIHRSQLKDAAATFSQTTGLRHELPNSACQNVDVGPLHGFLTPRQAWRKLLAPTCLVPRVWPWALSYRETFVGAPDGHSHHGPHHHISIKRRMPLREAFAEIAKQTDTPIQFFPSDPAQEQIRVGPITQSLDIGCFLPLLYSTIEDDEYVLFIGDFRPERGWVIEPWLSPQAVMGTGWCSCESDPAPEPKPDLEVLHTFTIEATRIVEGAVSQVLVIDQKRIRELGVSSVPELLQYISQTGYTWASGYQFSGAQHVTMRGTGQALVTINGRRAFPSANSLNTAEFDLNAIPIAAVERIEIMADSSSTLKGLDAIGGAVNVVLKDEADDNYAEVKYGGAQGGARERRATLRAAAADSTGRRHASVLVDLWDVETLLGSDRERVRDQNYQRYGGPDLRSLLSSPANFISMDGTNLPGRPSPVAGISASALVNGVLNADDLTATPNLTSLGQYESIAPARKKLTVLGSAHLPVRNTAIVGDVIYSTQDTLHSLQPVALFGVLSPAHPQNPFGQPVLYSGLLAGAKSMHYRTRSEWLRGAATFSGATAGWRWEIDAVHSRETTNAWLTNVADPLAVARGLGASDSESALNILDASNATTLAASQRLDSPEFTGSQLTATAQRPVFALPGGDISMYVGAEQRMERSHFPNGIGKAKRDVSSLFAQLSIPLVSEDMNLAAVKELSLLSGTRFDNYEDIGSGTWANHGVVWAVTSALKLRGSMSELYRVPSLTQLHTQETILTLPVFDPVRNESVVAEVLLGGRADLKPTEAVTRTLGAEFTSENGWRATAEYWRTSVDDRIAGLSEQLVLENEATLSDRVQRSAPADGLPGRVRRIDARLDNLGSLRADGIDVSFEQHIDVRGGTLAPRLGITWVRNFEFSDIPQQAGGATNRVGVASDQGSIMRTKLNASVSFEMSESSISSSVRCHPSYRDTDEGGKISQRKVDGRCYVDISGSTRLGDHVDLTFGVINLFDTTPDYRNRSEGYDPSQGDMRLRFAYGRIRHSF